METWAERRRREVGLVNGDLYSRAADCIESAYLHVGDTVIPSETVRSAVDARYLQLAALELLSSAYADERNLVNWAKKVWVTFEGLDHEALLVIAVAAVEELARLGFTAADAERRFREEFG